MSCNLGQKIKQTVVSTLAMVMVFAGITFGDAYVGYADDVTDTIDLSTFTVLDEETGAITDDGNVTATTDDTADETATIITIGAGGTYEFTGSGSNISIVVAKKITATVILSDATIDDSGYTNAEPETDEDGNVGDPVIEAPLVFKKNSVVTLELSGDSLIKCNPEDAYMENAIKHGKEDGKTLTFTGDGSLTVEDPYEDAIKYNGGNIDFEGGSVTVDGCLGDAVKCKLSSSTGGKVSIEDDAALTVKDCYGDGIQAENIDISGGTVDITLAYENASTSYYTYGSEVSGYNTIWESGDTTKYERVNVDTGSHKALKGGTKAKTEIYSKVADEDAETYTANTEYETEASGGITISGGTVNIDTSAAGLKANSVSTSGYTATTTGVYIIGSPDDGIHSNNTLEISGGTVNVAASDDGITAAGALTITGDSTVVNITESYEGIEGQTVTIGTSGDSTGPAVTIVSNDDGINSAYKSVTYTYDSSDDTDCNYLKTSVSSTSGNNTYIYSGSVQIDIDSKNSHSMTLAGSTVTYGSSGDGIDCNGSLDIEGGKVYVFGQSSGDNSPIDTNDGFTLADDAVVLAAGCDSMGETVPENGDGVYISYSGSSPVTAYKAGSSGSGSQPGQPGGGQPGGGQPGQPGGSDTTVVSANKVFTVYDGDTALISRKLPYDAAYVLYASSKLTSGSSYTVTIGDTVIDTGDDSGDDTGGGSGDDTGGGSGDDTGGGSGETVQTDISDAAVSGVSNKTYSGSYIKPAPVVVVNDKTLTAGTDYTVKYSKNKNVGTATVIITGAGDYTGTVTKTFKIRPKGTTISKLVKGSKRFTVKWKKQSAKMSASRITGYQIQYSTSKSFSSGNKKVTVKGYKNVKKVIKKLKKGKKYYVRIRTYKKVSGNNYYSTWSKAKAVKTK